MSRAGAVFCLLVLAAAARAQGPRDDSVGLRYVTLRLAIHGANSWIRDCNFVLNEPEALNDLVINGPGCGGVPVADPGWGALHARYRGSAGRR